MKHLGDFDASTVVYGKFTTFRPSTGAAYTLGGTPAISVYKDNSTTQSTTGVTLTVDFDSVTGLNHFAIDTSADGTFYSAGSFFDVVITTGTIDGVSVVGAVVASFTIRKNSALKPATAGRTVVVDAAGLVDANAVKVGPSGSGTAQTGVDIGARLDATITSRMASFTYTAPDNTGIGNIYAIVNHGTYGNSAINTNVLSRLATAGYTAPANSTINNIYNIVNDATNGNAAIRVQIDNIVSIVDHVTYGNAAIRTQLDTIDVSSIATSVNDIYSVVTDVVFGNQALQVLVDSRLSAADYIPPATAADIAALVQVGIIDEGDGNLVLQAIADKISADWTAGDLSAVAIAAAVRTNLTTELARIDATISSRLATAGYTAPDNTNIGNVHTIVSSGTYGNSALLAAVNTRLATAGYTAPLTSQQTRDAMKLAPSAGAAANNSIDDKIDSIEGGGGGGSANSGGGVLHARIADSSLAPDRFLVLIQGEEKIITFIVEANGRFDQESADDISVKFADPEGNVVSKSNTTITRVCETLDVQVFRVTLSSANTATLSAGVLSIEIAFDTQKAILTHAMKVEEAL